MANTSDTSTTETPAAATRGTEEAVRNANRSTTPGSEGFKRFIGSNWAERDESLPPADRFSATYLVALAARAIREVAGLISKAARSRKRLATLALDAEVRLARPADFPVFADDLARAVAEVIERHACEGADGRRFRVLAGAWPDKESTNPEEEG